MSTSPSARASSRLRIWPGWSKSKQPLVKTTRRALRFSRPNRKIASSSVRTAECKGSPCGPKKMISDEKIVYHAQEVRRPGAGDAVLTHFEELSHYRKLGSVLISGSGFRLQRIAGTDFACGRKLSKTDTVSARGKA